MKLYFGNAVATTTILMILALLDFIGWSVWGRAVIQYWGRRSVRLLVFGLVVCCFAAARDGLDKTIQHTIDGSCAPGVFPLVSVPTVVGCAGWKCVNASVGCALYSSANFPSSAITLTSFLRTSFNASAITMISVLSPT